MKQEKKSLTLKTLTKNNVWDIQENDVSRLWELAEKDTDFKDNMRHYIDIIRTAFEIEVIKIDRPEVIKKYEERGFNIGMGRVDDTGKVKLAVKKRPIMRVTDLTYENIRHISASKLLEVIGRNFGGGWDSLAQSIQDIIESGFDISTTTLPMDRLHKAGGLYEKKVSDGFDVLEIPKGTWVEAIFAKSKPEIDKSRFKIDKEDSINKKLEADEDEDEDEEVDLPEGEDNFEEEDEDVFDEDKLTEESYRTTFDTDPEDLSLEAEDVSDDDSDY